MNADCRPGPGRPRGDVDAQEVERLGALGLSQRRAAAALGLSDSGFRKVLRERPEIGAAWSRGLARRQEKMPTVLQTVPRIKALREAAGLSVAELARAAGVLPADVADLEAGLPVAMAPDYLRFIAREFQRRGLLAFDPDANGYPGKIRVPHQLGAPVSVEAAQKFIAERGGPEDGR